MAEVNFDYNQESQVGDTLYPGSNLQEQELNRALLMDYDYSKYVEGLTGYAGQNLQQICVSCFKPAVRTRIGRKGHYKAGLALRKDGALFAAPCVAIRGEGPYDVSFKIYVYTSSDNGIHWEKVNKTELHGKEPSLLCLDDGTLILTAQPIIEGKMGYSLPIYRSTDGGVNWSKSTIDGNRDYPRNLFVDQDGSICFMRCSSVRFEFEDIKEQGRPTLEINRSYDGGLTWRQSTGVIQDWDYPGFMEVSSLRLPSGRLVASLRHQPSGTKGEGLENTLMTWSSDNGASWTRPVRVSQTGEVHFHMTLLKNGALLATYSNYHLPYGICAKISRDEGVTWDQEHVYQLALSADYYTGWGVTCELGDGDLMTAYASTPYLCEPPDTTVCESLKWKLCE